MTLIAVTQRVDVVPSYHERRDALDQQWARFLRACGAVPVPIPNDPEVAAQLMSSLPVAGLLLTGGNDLCALGGSAPERDATERVLLEGALCRRVPVVGVCRGMQFIQAHWGVPLCRVDGHVTPAHEIAVGDTHDTVNSYHHFAATDSVPALTVWARAADGVVEAIRHVEAPVVGLMWHPERFPAFRTTDIALCRETWRL
jgi:putative glutamine amidotransferase